MPEKRNKKYEPKLTLKESAQFDDLLKVALEPPKKQVANRKRAAGKKK